MQENISNNRIAKNTIFLYARMAFTLLVGLYTSRVILNVLGVSDFGVFNVIAGFVSLFSFLNATLSSSVQRYYNYLGGQIGDEGYTKVYSVGLRVHIIIAIIVLFFIEIIGIWYVNNKMVFPEGRLEAANILFQFSAISLLLVILQVPYSGVILAKERMDYYALVSIVEVCIRLLLVIILPYIPYDKLIVYAAIQLFVTFLSFLMYVIYAKVNFTFLHLTRCIDKSLLKSLLSFSSWNLLGSIAFVFKSNGLNVLLNWFFGPIINAARGIAIQMHAAIMGFSNNISISFRPQLVESYAIGDIRRTYRLFITQSKICYCMILMIITPVIIEMDFLLEIWLGEAVPKYTNIFAALVLIDAMINTLNAPVTQVVYATGRIKYYQVFSSLVNILLLPACWFLLKMGFNAWITFLMTIFFSVLCQIVCLIVMHSVFSFSYKDYIKQIVYPCMMMTILVPIFPAILSALMKSSLMCLAIVSMASVLATCTLLYICFLTVQEKELVADLIRKFLKKDSLNNLDR